jgi:hypothetical protein
MPHGTSGYGIKEKLEKFLSLNILIYYGMLMESEPAIWWLIATACARLQGLRFQTGVLS